MNLEGLPPRLGITFVAAFEPEGLRPAAVAAESAELDQFWLWEDCFTHGGLSTTAVALASTERITVGIGLLPVPLRNVALTAMELASLHRLFPGRLIAGVGHGVQEWMGQVGARVASPMTLLEEYHDVLRRLLDGETVSAEGHYVTIDRVALRFPPKQPVSLMLGGRGPKSLRFAAHVADGTLLDAGQGEEEIMHACGLIADERHKNTPLRAEHHDVFAILIAATGRGADERVRKEIARWNPSPAPDIGVSGDAADIASAVNRLAQLGVTSVAIQPTEDEPELNGFIEFLGSEVKPRLLPLVQRHHDRH